MTCIGLGDGFYDRGGVLVPSSVLGWLGGLRATRGQDPREGGLAGLACSVNQHPTDTLPTTLGAQPASHLASWTLPLQPYRALRGK